MRQVTNRFVFWGVLCLLAFVETGCAGRSASQPTPTEVHGFTAQSGIAEVKCPFYVRQDINVSCGTLEVPEDYAKTDGKKIKLFVSIMRSTSPNPRRDPVLLLPYAASFSILSDMYYLAQTFRPLLDERDVVYYDPRGLGKSGAALDCPEFIDWYYQSLQDQVSPEQEFARLEPSLQVCRERLLNAGINPNLYTPQEMVADLNTLRLALGYSQFNLIAGGFGADLALTMVRDYPQTIRSAVLVDFTLPLNYTNLGNFETSAQQSLDLLFTRCATDKDCRQAYPELENHFYSVVDELNLSPAQVDVILPKLSQTKITHLSVSGSDFIGLVLTMLSSNRTIEDLPKLVEEVYQGKAFKLSEFFQRYRIVVPDEYYVGVELTHICSELHDGFWQNAPTGEAVQPVISQAVQDDWAIYELLCAKWTGINTHPQAGKLPSNAAPTLVMQGEFDPNYSPQRVDEILWGMQNTLHVVIPNMSKDVFGGESCAGNLVVEWLKSQDTGMDTSCVNQTPPLKFLMPEK